ncbi:hypothetical protein niasHT_008939 [Heterodera trifolii]|uniref:Uncharacterized protein n=1 Tax=Heterodera trifolii TaxID=157864 RepID=A0ABD2LY40_9BILA
MEYAFYVKANVLERISTFWQCSCCGQHFPYVACRICHEVKTLKIPTIGQNSQTRRRSSARMSAKFWQKKDLPVRSCQMRPNAKEQVDENATGQIVSKTDAVSCANCLIEKANNEKIQLKNTYSNCWDVAACHPNLLISNSASINAQPNKSQLLKNNVLTAGAAILATLPGYVRKSVVVKHNGKNSALLLGFKLCRAYFVASTNGTDPGTFKTDYIRSDFAVLHIAPTAYNMEFFRIDMAIAREELLASSDIYFFQSCPETLDIDSDFFECD